MTNDNMTNDKCRKLNFKPDKQFEELIELGSSPVRPESEIDRDCRVVEYEDFLQSKGFDYKETRLSRGGGVRSYENKVINKTVEVMKGWETNDIQYWIGRASDGKEISHGKGLNNLKKKV